MRKQTAFRNSELDRAKPRHHFFHSLLKRHHSDTGLVEDRTSSVTIVRIIVGLLLLHLIIIGGVLLRGHMVKGGGMIVQADHFPMNAPKAAPAAAASPAAPAAAGATREGSPLPPLAPTAPVATPDAERGATGTNHITQTVAADEDVAEDPDGEGVKVTSAATTTPVHHLVGRGDTWQSIAQQYGVSAEALKAANPGSPAETPVQGSTLIVPAGALSTAAAAVQKPRTVVASAAPLAPASSVSRESGKMYTVQRGETLSRISRKVHVPVKELMQLNAIKDANKIRPGMQLKLGK